MLNILNLKFI